MKKLKPVTDPKELADNKLMMQELEALCEKHGYKNALFVTANDREDGDGSIIRMFLKLKNEEKEKSTLDSMLPFFNRVLFNKVVYDYFTNILDMMDKAEAEREKKAAADKAELDAVVNKMTDEDKTKYFELIQTKKEFVMKQDYENASKVRAEERALLEKYGYVWNKK